MPVASFVATGTACGRHSVAAGARGCSPSPRPPPLPSARFFLEDNTLREHCRFSFGNRPPVRRIFHSPAARHSYSRRFPAVTAFRPISRPLVFPL